jgi:hypothetical protein
VLYKLDEKNDVEVVARLRSLVDQRAVTFEAATGQKPIGKDLETMIDSIMVEEIVDKGWMFEGRKPLIRATIADVPAAERKQIAEALRFLGKPVTDPAVVEYWIESQLRKKKR